MYLYALPAECLICDGYRKEHASIYIYIYIYAYIDQLFRRPNPNPLAQKTKTALED